MPSPASCSLAQDDDGYSLWKQDFDSNASTPEGNNSTGADIAPAPAGDEQPEEEKEPGGFRDGHLFLRLCRQ